MSTRDQGRRIYRSANGKQVDLDLLISRNELTPAVGNAKVNARGDELGPGGKIIRKREDILQDYYNQSSSMKDEVVRRPDPVQEAETSGASAEEVAEWEETEEGDFIKKAQPRGRRTQNGSKS